MTAFKITHQPHCEEMKLNSNAAPENWDI